MISFFNFSWCVMLLFERKQHLQSYDAQSSMQREILYFTELLIDHPFKVNILGEGGSDDKRFENVCK